MKKPRLEVCYTRPNGGQNQTPMPVVPRIGDVIYLMGVRYRVATPAEWTLNVNGAWVAEVHVEREDA
jgi:hypothetical protein